MGAKYTEAQANATKNYLKNMEEIKIRVPIGKKGIYRQMAEDAGYNSLNQFIIDCLDAESEKLSINAIIKEERQE